MAAATLTAPVSPEAFRGSGEFTQWGDPKVYVLSVNTTNTLDTGLLGIERWAISKMSGGTISATLAATTGIFTFTTSADPVTCELLVWGPDVFAIASGGTA